MPSPGCRTGGPAPLARRSRRVDDPTTIVDRASTPVADRTWTPSTVMPFVDPRSSTVTPCGPTPTNTWLRLSASSSTTRPVVGARPTTTPGGDSGRLRPASGPPTTTRSSTGRGPCPRGRGAGTSPEVTATDAPCRSGGMPDDGVGRQHLPPAAQPRHRLAEVLGQGGAEVGDGRPGRPLDDDVDRPGPAAGHVHGERHLHGRHRRKPDRRRGRVIHRSASRRAKTRDVGFSIAERSLVGGGVRPGRRGRGCRPHARGRGA